MTSIYASLKTQRIVIFALFLSEIKTRFGKYRLGYIWAVFEPLAHIAFILMIFGIRSERMIPGIDFPVFLIVGIVPFFMFKNILIRLMNAIDENRKVFKYKQVTPMDVFMARLTLEGFIYFFVYILLIAAANMAGYNTKINDPLGLCAILAILYVFSFSLGVIVCIIGTLYKEAKNFFRILIFPLFFFSAVFYPISIVSPTYRQWLAWNPIVHFMELLRTSFFDSFNTKTGDIVYIISWTVLTLILGLSIYRLKRTKVLASG